MATIKQCDRCKEIVDQTESTVRVSEASDRPWDQIKELCHPCDASLQRFLNNEPTQGRIPSKVIAKA